jgi:hypothetical protein
MVSYHRQRLGDHTSHAVGQRFRSIGGAAQPGLRRDVASPPGWGVVLNSPTTPTTSRPNCRIGVTLRSLVGLELGLRRRSRVDDQSSWSSACRIGITSSPLVTRRALPGSHSWRRRQDALDAPVDYVVADRAAATAIIAVHAGACRK